MGKEEDTRAQLLSEDYLLMDEPIQNCDFSFETVKQAYRVQPLFNPKLKFKMIDQESSCWQELWLRDIPDLLQPKHISKLIDEKGVVVGLISEQIEAISRVIAYNKSDLIQKVYHIGQTYKESASTKNQFERMRPAPKGSTTACFALVNPNLKARSEIQSLAFMSNEELMLEVDLLRLTE